MNIRDLKTTIFGGEGKVSLIIKLEIFFKTLFQIALMKCIVGFAVVKAFIKNPFDFRTALIPEYDAFGKFYSARFEMIEKSSYTTYIEFLIQEKKLFAQDSKVLKLFTLPNGQQINVRHFRLEPVRQLVYFNATDHLMCSYSFIEGLIGLSNNKQADMRQALAVMGHMKFKTDKAHKPTKILSVVPFYNKIELIKDKYTMVPAVLINDEFVLSYNEMDKIIPGYQGDDTLKGDGNAN